jgi:hypothetical protein
MDKPSLPEQQSSAPAPAILTPAPGSALLAVLRGASGEVEVPPGARFLLRQHFEFDIDLVRCDEAGRVTCNPASELPGWISDGTLVHALIECCTGLQPKPAAYEVKIEAWSAWDNWNSNRSDPLTDIMRAAAVLGFVSAVKIPRHIWAVLLRHPVVLNEYSKVRFQVQEQPVCSACGAVRAVCSPPLDAHGFERLLQASSDGPLLPGCVKIWEHAGNTVHLESDLFTGGARVQQHARILNPLWRVNR